MADLSLFSTSTWHLRRHENLITFLLFFADSSVLKPVEESYLELAIKNHPALDSVMHLLPENVLVSGDENIPGLVASPAGKCQQDCFRFCFVFFVYAITHLK